MGRERSWRTGFFWRKICSGGKSLKWKPSQLTSCCWRWRIFLDSSRFITRFHCLLFKRLVRAIDMCASYWLWKTFQSFFSRWPSRNSSKSIWLSEAVPRDENGRMSIQIMNSFGSALGHGPPRWNKPTVDVWNRWLGEAFDDQLISTN